MQELDHPLDFTRLQQGVAQSKEFPILTEGSPTGGLALLSPRLMSIQRGLEQVAEDCVCRRDPARLLNIGCPLVT